MKKLISLFWAVCTCLFIGIMFTACNEESDHEHSWGEWNTVLNANCIQEGKQERSCSCGEKETKTIPKISHTEVMDVAVSATCEKTGLTEGSHCSVCDEIIIAQTVVDALGHNNDGVVAHKDATCTEAGVVGGTYCTRCENGKAAAETPIVALGHTEKIISGKAASCTEDGLTDGKQCSVCETIIVKQEKISATGHEINRGVCGNCFELVASEGLEFTVVDGKYYLSSLGTCDDKEIIIPNVYEGVDVVGISAGVFSGNTYITYVYIPDSIVTIEGTQTFYACSSLETVRLSDNLLQPLSYMFGYCSSLNEMSIPTNWTYIAEYMFIGCSKLEKINLNTISEIKIQAFKNCSLLKNIDLGNTRTIDYEAFYGCSSIQTLNFSNSLVNIGSLAFGDCDGITGTLTIPENVVSIGSGAFYNCGNINTIYFNAINVETSDYAFKLVGKDIDGTALIIGKNSTFIPEKLFGTDDARNAANIISLKFEDGNASVEIAPKAFVGCRYLKTIEIPFFVKYIGSNAFASCTSLEYVYYDPSDELVYTYSNAFHNCGTESDSFEFVIGKNVTYIPYRLLNESGVTEIVFEKGGKCTYIGQWAFAYCTRLTSITVGDALLTVDSGAFIGCSALAKVNIYDIGSFAGISYMAASENLGEWSVSGRETLANPLYYAKNLYCENILVTELIIPETVTKIGCGAFMYCTSIVSVKIPQSVKEIGNYAFYGCSSLTDADIETTTWYRYDDINDETGTKFSLPYKYNAPNYRVIKELEVCYYLKSF